MKMCIYVFGPNVGESIVLQYPKDLSGEYHWGVIDCHSEDVLHFLQTEKKVDKLDFVCWTHPHEDHHKGMPSLLQAYKGRICRFWRFGGHNASMLSLFHDLHTKNTKNTNQRKRFLRIKQIFNFALEQKKNGTDSYKMLTDLHQGLIDIKYNTSYHFKVSSLSPSSRLAEDYTSQLGKCLKQIKLSGEQSDLDWEGLERGHNDISVVLLVEFGKTRLLFGSDAEQKSWVDIVSSDDRQQVALDSHFVKISHHGSEKAYYKAAWTDIARHANPPAVVTPFAHSRLPTNKGLTLLQKHCKEIYLTASGKHRKDYSRSTLFKHKYKWKPGTANTDYCTFEFDHLGNLTKASLSDSAVVFSDS